MRSTSSSSTPAGRRKEGMLVRISPPPLRSFSNSTQRIAERHQIARHRERGRPGADQGDALAVLLLGDLGHEGIDLALVVGGDALQAADGDGLLLHAAAPAGRLARAIADATQDARKDVALPVEHVGGRIAAAARSAGCIRGRAYASDTPTGNRRLYGNTLDWRCRSGPCGPCFARQSRSLASRPSPCVSPQPPTTTRSAMRYPNFYDRSRVDFSVGAQMPPCIAGMPAMPCAVCHT